jgi:hypothetical protein
MTAASEPGRDVQVRQIVADLDSLLAALQNTVASLSQVLLTPPPAETGKEVAQA